MNGDRAPMSRCMVVWLLVSAGCAAALSGVRWLCPAPTAGSFDQLLPQLAALALAGCVVWFWWVTTWTTVVAARGITRGALLTTPGCRRSLQRALLAACGLALVGVGSPALADPVGHPAPTIVAGLPLPQRASDDPLPAAPRRHSPEAVSGSIVVRPGDTLWDLAAADLPPGSSDAAITTAWRALYDANRALLADPDLIYPGTRLDRPQQEES